MKVIKTRQKHIFWPHFSLLSHCLWNICFIYRLSIWKKSVIDNILRLKKNITKSEIIQH